MVPETGVIMNNEMDGSFSPISRQALPLTMPQDFSIPSQNNSFGYIPTPSNYIVPHKRPLSSIAPVIVEHPNHTLYYVVGAAGGSRIITAVIQSLWHVLDHGMSAVEAAAQPRFHDQLLPNLISFEWGSGVGNGTGNGTENEAGRWAESEIGIGEVKGYDNGTVEFMVARGHNVSWVPPGYSAAHSLRLCGNGTFEAVGDPRQVDSGGLAV